MSIQNNSIINLDDQGDEEDEEVNAEDYSHESSLLPSNKKKSFRTGRKFSNIWKYFKAGNQVGRGHYQATCNFCNKFWSSGKPKRMTAHICNSCPKVNNDIRKAILGEFVKEYGDVPSNESDDDTEIERTNIKRPRLDNTLDSFFNNVEVAKINLRVEGELERSKNLTLNEISSDVVKKILQRRGFFDDMEALAQILKPIRTAIQELETTSITLADCYIHLIKIAAAFKGLPLEDYRRIGVNKKYFPKILTHAANIWRDLGHKQESCKELLGQLRKYHLQIEPYNTLYSTNIDTPYSWWITCNDTTNHLKSLALKLFSITPNSVGCERMFSALGWFYGKRHNCLSLEKVESMAKINRYYLTNAKKELGFVAKNKSEDDVQLEQLLSISQVVVVINNENIDEHCQEEVTSDSTNNEEDYDPAELASGYLSDFE
ncbi:308_t:CDS:2 [Entrophospora sp. SA101]|nr:308_t:CDS:2 [Entrophospora sp. SA101]